MEYTQNYALLKPEGTDECSNAPLNMNADEIDRVMHEMQEQLDLHGDELDNKLGRTETAAAAVLDGAGGNIAEQFADDTNDLGIVKTTLGTSCKNYVQVNCEPITKNGVTLTPNDDGSITIAGESTSSSFALAYCNLRTGSTAISDQVDSYQLLPPGEYILSGSGVSNVGFQICGMTSDTSAITTIASTTIGDKVVTISDEYIYTWARLTLSNNVSQTYDNITVYPMIRRADVTDDTYAPYKPSLQAQIDELSARLAALETTQ